MKNHVTSLAISREMKELGFPQESEFWWSSWKRDKCDIPACNCGKPHETWNIVRDGDEGYYENVPAYLATELLAFFSAFKDGFLVPKDKLGEWVFLTEKMDVWEPEFNPHPDSIANVLIFGMKNGIIDPKKLTPLK